MPVAPADVLTHAEIERFRRIPTPTVANAIDRLRLAEADAGYTDSSIVCRFPELGAIVGYAVTLTVRSAAPSKSPKHGSRKAHWDRVLQYPGPRIVVAQDLDLPPRGAYWGEVNANIHRALGCVGLITDGLVRDLDEVRQLGFGFWSSGVSVSHAYAHMEDFDVPVTIGGLLVRPGDLVHADQHGACIIPAGKARDVLAATDDVVAYEAPMIALAKSGDFSTAAMAELLKHETV